MNPFLTENELVVVYYQAHCGLKKHSQECYLNIESGYKHRLG